MYGHGHLEETDGKLAIYEEKFKRVTLHFKIS